MSRQHWRVGRLISIALSLTVAVAACSSTGSASDTGENPAEASVSPSGSADVDASDTPVPVVASTNVYGSIVELIGGDRVEVTSLIADLNQDPHSYEATTRDQLAVSKAKLAVKNGGGYDDFIDQMLYSAGNDGTTILDAVDIAGIQPNDDGETNEHVWYDLASMKTLAGKIADALADIDPAGADVYRSGGDRFDEQVKALQDTVSEIRNTYEGTAVAITEPVPLYLLEAMGLDNQTPEDFSEAIEEDTDVPPLVMQETLDLFTSRTVSLLVYNEQTSGPETEQVLAAAQNADIPAIPVAETLPGGQDYLTWMDSNIKAIADGLGEQ